MTTNAATITAIASGSDTAYLDTNVILSYLLGEPPATADAARMCLAAADRGDVCLLITPTTLAEVVWVLSSAYREPRHEIASQVLTFISAQGISSENQDEITQALSLYRDKKIDFADALLAARCLLSGLPVIYSFDRHFDRVPGLQRLVPGQPSPTEDSTR